MCISLFAFFVLKIALMWKDLWKWSCFYALDFICINFWSTLVCPLRWTFRHFLDTFLVINKMYFVTDGMLSRTKSEQIRLGVCRVLWTRLMLLFCLNVEESIPHKNIKCLLHTTPLHKSSLHIQHIVINCGISVRNFLKIPLEWHVEMPLFRCVLHILLALWFLCIDSNQSMILSKYYFPSISFSRQKHSRTSFHLFFLVLIFMFFTIFKQIWNISQNKISKKICIHVSFFWDAISFHVKLSLFLSHLLLVLIIAITKTRKEELIKIFIFFCCYKIRKQP